MGGGGEGKTHPPNQKNKSEARALAERSYRNLLSPFQSIQVM